jgi:hypothetical protein
MQYSARLLTRDPTCFSRLTNDVSRFIANRQCGSRAAATEIQFSMGFTHGYMLSAFQGFYILHFSLFTLHSSMGFTHGYMISAFQALYIFHFSLFTLPWASLMAV